MLNRINYTRLWCRYTYPREIEITEFKKKYSRYVAKEILLSQKDIGSVETLKLYPIYMLPFILEEL